jgi:multidrug efflux pump subunit AcrB
MKLNNGSLLKKPITTISICLFLIAVSFFILINSRNRVEAETSNSYTITIKHYGTDMNEIERTISVPLEDALSSVYGIKNILSLSEDDRSRVFVTFGESNSLLFRKNSVGNYEVIRDIVQRVYETLPPSVQRPEIVPTNSSINPVLTAAVFSKNKSKLNITMLNKLVKPAFTCLDGVADVEISGIGINEIVIVLKPEQVAVAGLTSTIIANVLAANDILLPGGYYHDTNKENIIIVDGRYDSVASLSSALIPLPNGGYITLKEIADIEEREREPDIISRLNGEQIAAIAILPLSGANTGKISKLVTKVLKNFSDSALDFIIINDRGEEERKAFYSVIIAAVQAMIVLIIVFFFLTRKSTEGNPGTNLIAIGVIPVSGLISAAMLVILGENFNKITLAGMAIGLGSAIDSAILGVESFRKVNSVNDAKYAIKKIYSPLVSGSFTTIIALMPLVLFPSTSKTIIAVAESISIVTFVSMMFVLLFVPSFFLWTAKMTNCTGNKKRTSSPVNSIMNIRLPLNVANFGLKCILRKIKRLALRSIIYCMKKPAYVCLFVLLLSVGGITAVLISGADVGEAESEDSLFLQIEFPGGYRKEEVDSRVLEWAQSIRRNKGINNIQTGSSIGSATVLINFNPALIKNYEVRELAANETVQGGFVYINEASAKERNWEVTIFGDSAEKCKMIAEEAAVICASMPFIQQTVFNFKEGSPKLFLEPDRGKISSGPNSNMITFREIAGETRNALFGPVVYKRADNESGMGELDVRIKNKSSSILSKTDIKKIVFSKTYDNSNSVFTINNVVNSTEKEGLSSIRRENRRRFASLSVKTKPNDPRRIRDLLMPGLNQIILEPGYSIEFDRTAIEDAESLSGMVYLFLLAILFCYIVIAVSTQSFFLPLPVLSIIPPSVALPALFVYCTGLSFNMLSACAFIAVCGVAVNSAVLLSDDISRCLSEKADYINLGVKEKYSILYKSIHKKLPALLATSITTISTSLPFLFLDEGANIIIRTLSLVTALGTGASCLFSLFLIPSLAVLMPFLFIKKEII